jgi:hypothetical protein
VGWRAGLPLRGVSRFEPPEVISAGPAFGAAF